ncbi:cell division protein FtsQ/DivIB [Aureimonas altamirensis]|uniref:cell division protein FtsQ/DivIB n=1 Tax=Aureimonas altamirensis TaxID=370622 RepID=UPI0020372A85|nr:cell division protein FtsQ/DivIB [Aureimonas altamirensis]MCM2503708.1 cell division protein FtsQ/DivIB [Aureimonas altamirensis]
MPPVRLRHDHSDMRPAGRVAMRVQIALRRVSGYARRLQALPLPSFSVLATVVLGSSALYGMSSGGHTTKVIDTLAEPVGFAIDRVDVTGASETSQIDILQTVYGVGAQTLPALDVDAARTALEAMPWIETASVSKVYPGQLLVEVVEKQPFAIWQRGQDLTIIDRHGVPIVPFATTRYTELPLVVGVGADTAAADLLDEIELVPELKPRIRAYVRIGERRWDLRLDNGVTVRLPEEQPVEAAAEVVRMDRSYGLLARDIAAVDMRLPDRITIKLTPEAKQRRDDAAAERAKLARQAKRGNPA